MSLLVHFFLFRSCLKFVLLTVSFLLTSFQIRTFLFSPFGKQYLKKLLQFHVVPQQIFHSDYYLNATRGSKGEVESLEAEEVDMPKSHIFEKEYEPTSLADMPHFPRPPMPKRPSGDKCKAKVTRHVLPTLLGSAKNESLAVNVYEYRLGFGKGPLVRRLAVGHVGQEEHDYSKVFIGDGVAWGGAVHVSSLSWTDQYNLMVLILRGLDRSLAV